MDPLWAKLVIKCGNKKKIQMTYLSNIFFLDLAIRGFSHINVY